MSRKTTQRPETVKAFLSEVRRTAPGQFEVTGQGNAGCELTFQSSHIHFEVLDAAAEETGMFLNSVDFENHALTFYVEDVEEGEA